MDVSHVAYPNRRHMCGRLGRRAQRGGHKEENSKLDRVNLTNPPWDFNDEEVNYRFLNSTRYITPSGSYPLLELKHPNANIPVNRGAYSTAWLIPGALNILRKGYDPVDGY